MTELEVLDKVKEILETNYSDNERRIQLTVREWIDNHAGPVQDMIAAASYGDLTPEQTYWWIAKNVVGEDGDGDRELAETMAEIAERVRDKE